MEWPPALTKRTGGLFLVALAVPGVGAARVARRCPDTPVRLAVAVDVDVQPRGAVRVDALPAVGGVAEQLGSPATLPVLVLARD